MTGEGADRTGESGRRQPEQAGAGHIVAPFPAKILRRGRDHCLHRSGIEPLARRQVRQGARYRRRDEVIKGLLSTPPYPRGFGRRVAGSRIRGGLGVPAPC